jgi:hypothetical protein
VIAINLYRPKRDAEVARLCADHMVVPYDYNNSMLDRQGCKAKVRYVRRGYKLKAAGWFGGSHPFDGSNPWVANDGAPGFRSELSPATRPGQNTKIVMP